MLAQARAKAERRGWENIDLVCADVTALKPGWLGRRLSPEQSPNGAEAVLFTYSLSVMANWPQAWRAATAAARPGARVAVVDLRTPTGTATAMAPLASLACKLGGSDITAHPWTALERDCTDVQAWSLRGGHIQVRAGTLNKP
jgi:S-adenosylmethionine-diacylgycerolhomoserine-N-methlytransferase